MVAQQWIISRQAECHGFDCNVDFWMLNAYIYINSIASQSGLLRRAQSNIT